MRSCSTILAFCIALGLQCVASAESDLLAASKDAPLFQLSNLRTETDRLESLS